MTVRICEWRSQEFEAAQTGLGRLPPYCPAECRRKAQNALAAGRMRRMREGRRDPFYRPKRGRPPKG